MPEKPIVLRRIPLGLQRQEGSVCYACGRGVQSGLDWWEINGHTEDGVLLCYLCAARAVADITKAGVKIRVEIVGIRKEE